MVVIRTNFNGNPNLGVYAIATDKYVLVRFDLYQKTLDKLKETFKVPVLRTKIAESPIIGIFAVGNSNGILVPYFTLDSEIKMLKEELDIIVERVPSKMTALGNIILANDKGAIAHPGLERKAIKVIEDVLDVEVVCGKIYRLPLVGSMSVATNKGAIVHPMASDEELEWLSSVLKVPVDIGTVNHGSPFVGAGMIANSYGAATGLPTTGPELLRIERALEI